MSMNPFEHKHTHYHDDDEDLAQVMDPAQRSLADALRVSFGLLKIVMVILVLIYLGSGFFTVKEQEVVVRLMFGRIMGQTAEDQVVTSEGRFHWGWPFPIQQLVRVDTSPRQLRVHDAFWYGEGSPGARGGPLNPERDGSLLTGDANIVHARFVVNYRVGFASLAGGGEGERSAQAALDFVKNIGDMSLAENMVRTMAEEAVVRTMAGVRADDFLLDRVDRDRRRIRDAIQERLDEVGSGILVTSVEVGDRRYPLEVSDAYLAATSAQNDRGSRVAEARRQSEEILTASAGAAYPQLLRLVDRYEALTRLLERSEDEPMERELEHRRILRRALEKAFSQSRLPMMVEPETDEGIAALAAWADTDPNTGANMVPMAAISGRVATRVRDAESTASNMVRDMATEAERFRILREEYRQSLYVMVDQRWQSMLEEIFGENNRRPRFFIAPGHAYLDINIDPQLRAELERERLRRDRERREGGGRGQ
ncbi:MAG: hypothetical protein JJU36_17845 [Phycisphaeraceae bacterium]|nr:hypothetical protein [Phycisphaeraceae bacterium]